MGVRALIDSMTWVDEATLELDCENGKSVRIRHDGGFWSTHEFRRADTGERRRGNPL